MARSLRPDAVVERLVAHVRARRRGEALERLARGEWPVANVLGNLFGTWAAARAAASGESLGAAPTGGSEPVQLIGHRGAICVPQSTEIARKSDDPRRCFG